MRSLLLLVFCVTWLLPFFYAGLMGGVPFVVPARLANQYNAAGLFTKRMTHWSQMLIQIRFGKEDEWQTIDTADVCPMGAFGYRQRPDRILQETNGREVGHDVRKRMAQWIAIQFQKTHPEAPPVHEVRFAQTVWPVNTPAMAYPPGHWIPNPSSLPSDVRFIPLELFRFGRLNEAKNNDVASSASKHNE